MNCKLCGSEKTETITKESEMVNFLKGGGKCQFDLYDVICHKLEQVEGIREKKIIIYPFGVVGAVTKGVLNTYFEIKEELIIDNYLCQKNRNIEKIDYLSRLSLGEYLILFACNNPEIYWELYNALEEYVDSQYIIKLFELTNNRVGRHSYGPICDQTGVKVEIGSFCSFAEGSAVIGNHDVYITSHEFVSFPIQETWKDHPGYVPGIKVKRPRQLKMTRIGNDVWIGRNALIIAGTTIGNGVIIGAGAVVTKDIPDYAIAVGVPAKIIKYRYSEEQIQKMNSIAWWNWPDEKICKFYDDFYLDIETFIEKHGEGLPENL